MLWTICMLVVSEIIRIFDRFIDLSSKGTRRQLSVWNVLDLSIRNVLICLLFSYLPFSEYVISNVFWAVLLFIDLSALSVIICKCFYLYFHLFIYRYVFPYLHKKYIHIFTNILEKWYSQTYYTNDIHKPITKLFTNPLKTIRKPITNIFTNPLKKLFTNPLKKHSQTCHKNAILIYYKEPPSLHELTCSLPFLLFPFILIYLFLFILTCWLWSNVLAVICR